MDEIYISVIITAYNRRKFLLEAVQSVLNQTLGREKYEIIVIKNFRDDTIDKLTEENHIKNIMMDDIIGNYLYKGITEARGNIISFLDDDDIFFQNKLEVVYNIFKSNSNLVFYHNLPQFIDELKTPLNKSGNALSFNLSCISIKKNIVNLQNIKNIYILQDSFMLYSAFESNGLIISGKQLLSYYRLHNSASNFNGSNVTKIQFKNKLNQTFISQLEVFENYFKSRKAKKYIINYMVTLKLNNNIFYKLGYSQKYYNLNVKEIIKYLLIFNYWGKRKGYILKYLKLLEVHVPEKLLRRKLERSLLP